MNFSTDGISFSLQGEIFIRIHVCHLSVLDADFNRFWLLTFYYY